MKCLRYILLPVVIASFTVVSVYSSDTSLTIPLFPTGGDGKIEITGIGISSMSKSEMVDKTIDWIYMNVGNGDISEDGAAGNVTAHGRFVIAREELCNGMQTVEFMEYNVTVLCGDRAYSYAIDDVNVYIVTAVPVLKGDDSESNIQYDILDITSVTIPEDYVVLIEAAAAERQRLRIELESLLEEDISEFRKIKLLKYERHLDEAAQWYAVIDIYYRTVLENYMACYDYLTALQSSLNDILGGDTAEALLTDTL